MVTAASPSDDSVNGHSTAAGKGEKRKAEDDSPQAQTHTRSKRSRYISIACNECKRRKIKCNGQTPCQRCGNLMLDCVYAPNCCTNSLKDSQEFKQVQEQLIALQDTVNDLQNVVSELHSQAQFTSQDRAMYPPPDHSSSMAMTRTLPPLISSKRHNPQRTFPQFHGPTSSIYGFDVAKSSLSNMGIIPPPEPEGQMSRDRSQAASPLQLPPYHPDKDPLWMLNQQEAMRLVDIYDQECHITYPILDMEKLFAHINQLYTFIGAALRTGFAQPGMPGEDALDDDMTTTLKLVLAIGLIIEGHGEHELGQKMFDSAKRATDMVIIGDLSIRACVLIILTATYHFQKDEETQAWRFIGIAGRQCIEMGLHRRDSLMRLFNNQDDLQHAIRVFWVVYALDRRWSFGTGMPFALQDSDIDPTLPEPDNKYPYLKQITIYNHIGTKIWAHISALESGTRHARQDDINYLDFQITQWYQQLPDHLKFDSSNLQKENEVPDRRTRRLRFLMFLRKNQARISVYRPILHSATSIVENRQYAEAVVNIAKDTINTIIAIDKTTDIYRTQQVCFNYFLVQALAVIFLAVAHAPAIFRSKTTDEFYGAIDLIKGFSTKSYTTRRLWRTIRGLKDLGQKIGMYGTEIPVHSQHQSQQQHPSHRQRHLENDAHSNAALGLAGLAGHKVDSYSTIQNNNPALRNNSVDVYSPEDASQMGNELTALFEMAGAYGNNSMQNGVHGGNGGGSGLDGYAGGYGGTPAGNAGGADDGGDSFNAMFGNEPEFSRIMNELL